MKYAMLHISRGGDFDDVPRVSHCAHVEPCEDTIAIGVLL